METSLSWDLQHECEWLWQQIRKRRTRQDKVRFVKDYMTSLQWRHLSFTGNGPLEEDEHREMETYCLKQLYTLEKGR